MTLAIKIQIMNELFYVWKHSVELLSGFAVCRLKIKGELAQLVRATES
tara:strand:- start:310 stop:453 length:144 start_codon:yes stop_codon:yes gene_type:complete